MVVEHKAKKYFGEMEPGKSTSLRSRQDWVTEYSDLWKWKFSVDET